MTTKKKVLCIDADWHKWPKQLSTLEIETLEKYVESRKFLIDNPRKNVATHLQELWDEIPIEAKPIATVILQIVKKFHEEGLEDDPYNCMLFRNVLYSAVTDFDTKRGILLPVPRAWWTDGPWIPADWVVQIMNGIIRWRGDLSCKLCHGGADEDCPFCLTKDELDSMEGRIEATKRDRVKIVLEDLL